ncbi:hypothetical protein MK137Hg34_000278900, partial [Viscerimonas tarda]
LSNGGLQAGIQVGLNGIGNLADGHNFFDNWYWSAGMGFASGAISGYNLAQAGGRNYWWGNEVQYGRTPWSFFTSEMPYKTINFPVNNVGSLKPNDCVPTTLLENSDYFGGNLTYEQAVIDSKYQEGIGAGTNRTIDKEILAKRFRFTDMGTAGLSDPDWVKQNIKDAGALVNVNMKQSTNRHSDVLRSVRYYHSGKVELQFRIGSYNLKSVNKDWRFYLIRGLK